MKHLSAFLTLFLVGFGISFMLPASLHAQENNQKDDKVFFMADKMPQFPGGAAKLEKHISNNLHYPDKAKKQELSGIVYVKFVIASNGKVTQVEVRRGVDPLLDEAARKVVESFPDWKPGKKNGKRVAVSQAIPIQFNL